MDRSRVYRCSSRMSSAMTADGAGSAAIPLRHFRRHSLRVPPDSVPITCVTPATDVAIGTGLVEEDPWVAG